jgi:signal transduction histidine kinase
MPNAVIDIEEKKFISPSEEVCAFLGRTEGELNDFRANAKELTLLARQTDSGERTPLYLNVLRNGKPFNLGIFPIDFINSKKTRLNVFLFDAGNDIKRQTALEDSSRALRFMASFAGNLLVLSGDGLILEGSEGLFNFWRVNFEDVREQPFILLLASSDKKNIQEKILSSAYFSEEVSCLRGDGTRFKAVMTAERKLIDRKLHITARFSGGELPTGFEEEDEQKKLNSLISFIPALTAIGSRTEILSANKEFLDFFGCANTGEFCNRYEQLDSLFTPRKGYLHSKSGDWLSQAEYYMNNDSIVKVLLYSAARDEYRTFSFTFKKIINSDKYIFIFIDITDIDNRRFVLQDVNQMLEQEVEKQSNEKRQTALLLKQQEELLVQQSKMVTMGNMVNVISHQWKQPLSTMRMLSYNLWDDYKDGLADSDKLYRYVKEITSQIEFMAETIDDFRTFFSPSKKLMKFDVAEPINSVSRLLRPLLARSRIILTYYGADLPQALGLPNELRQVLMSLIINSVEAITETRQNEPERGNSYIGEIAIDASADESSIYVNVADNGGGIRPEVMERIFEPHVTTKTDKGTGTGLYISKVAMTNMNGRISVRNSAGGTVFTLSLCRA